MRREYDFASMKGVRGKYAKRYHRRTNLVLLDPDLAHGFTAGVLRLLRVRNQAQARSAEVMGTVVGD